MITLFKIFENISEIQKYLEKKFPKKNVVQNDKPIKLGFHTEDYDINGIKVRLRFWSPFHSDDKAIVAFYPLTPEQLKEVDEINKTEKEKKEKKKKEDDKLKKDMIEWGYERSKRQEEARQRMGL